MINEGMDGFIFYSKHKTRQHVPDKYISCPFGLWTWILILSFWNLHFLGPACNNPYILFCYMLLVQHKVDQLKKKGKTGTYTLQYIIQQYKIIVIKGIITGMSSIFLFVCFYFPHWQLSVQTFVCEQCLASCMRLPHLHYHLQHITYILLISYTSITKSLLSWVKSTLLI